MRAIALLLAISLTACARDIPRYHPIAVPTGLTAPVATPEKPDPQALTTCNARLTVIRQWSEQWTRPTAPQR